MSLLHFQTLICMGYFKNNKYANNFFLISNKLDLYKLNKTEADDISTSANSLLFLSWPWTWWERLIIHIHIMIQNYNKILIHRFNLSQLSLHCQKTLELSFLIIFYLEIKYTYAKFKCKCFVS